MKIWPAILPQFVRRSDWELEALRPRISFEPDEGNPIERRNGSVDIDDQTCSVYLKKEPVDQVAVFRSFVDNDLEGGVQEFLFRDPLSGQQTICKIMGDRPYRIQPVSGVEFVATFQLRTTNL